MRHSRACSGSAASDGDNIAAFPSMAGTEIADCNQYGQRCWTTAKVAQRHLHALVLAMLLRQQGYRTPPQSAKTRRFRIRARHTHLQAVLDGLYRPEHGRQRPPVRR